MSRAESSITRLEATVAIAALTCYPKHGFDVGPAMPAFFRLALTTVAVKSLSPNFPHDPLVRFDLQSIYKDRMANIMRFLLAASTR